MKVLVVGGGGREHAICWKLAQSPKVDKLYCAPGNAGIEQVAECVNVGAEDIEGICALAAEKAIDLAVIGPEVPLAMGITDELESRGIKVFGPNRKCYVANEDSDTIVEFDFDSATGQLIPTLNIVHTGSPVCIVFTQD